MPFDRIRRVVLDAGIPLHMKKMNLFKKFILLVIVAVIVMGGIYFDVRETNDFIDDMCYSLEASSDDLSIPVKNGNVYIDRSSSIIAAVAEIRDASIIREVIRRLERRSDKETIPFLSLILFLCLSIGIFYLNVLPSIYPWTDIISSRRSIICYIHLQDGAK